MPMRQAWMLALALRRTLLWLALGLLLAGAAMAAEPSDIETKLNVTMPGGEARSADLAEAMALLNIPSVSVALIDQDRIAWAKAYGQDATPDSSFPSRIAVEIRGGRRRHASRRTKAPRARPGCQRAAHLLGKVPVNDSTRRIR